MRPILKQAEQYPWRVGAANEAEQFDPASNGLIWDWGKGRWVRGESPDGRVVPEMPKEMGDRARRINDRAHDDYQKGRRG